MCKKSPSFLVLSFFLFFYVKVTLLNDNDVNVLSERAILMYLCNISKEVLFINAYLSAKGHYLFERSINHFGGIEFAQTG